MFSSSTRAPARDTARSSRPPISAIGAVPTGASRKRRSIWRSRKGGVDPDRLAVTGLSYGGFMTNWIIGQTNRYRVAASENGICNLVSFYTTSDIGWFWMEGEWGRPVWSNLDFYMARSPISYVERIQTPTMFLQAEGDWRCPIEQGEQFYTALSARGVPCETDPFPRR